MFHKFITVIILILTAVLMVHAQEMQKGEMSPMPPQPLQDEWHQWLIGEWEGTTDGNMGKTRDWMKIDWGPGKQFLVMHYKGKTTEVNPDMLSKAAKKMNMPEAQLKEMMMQDYLGLGVTTVNPKTGELMGYWFDSYRDISEGQGTREGNATTMTWSSAAMGSMTRTVERVSEDEMKIKMHGKDPSGLEYDGTSVMKRKK